MFMPQHNETLRTVLWGLGAIGTEDEQRTVDAVYRALEPINFSKGFRENISKVYPETISDLLAPQVVWRDWSSPQRLLDSQQLLGLRPTRSDADQSPRAHMTGVYRSPFIPSPPLPKVLGGRYEITVTVGGFAQVIPQTR